jgi:adenosylcobinamide-phosphate synthase
MENVIAYLIDWIVGEFRFVRHPVVVIGDAVGWFERWFYRDSVWRGAWLALVVVGGVLLAALGLTWGVDAVLPQADYPLLHAILIGTIASTTLASKMLYDSVHNVIAHPETIRYLVSRDTDALTPSQIHKAAIETYAENLSDGVVAPLFYLVLFGLPGAFVYKAINTLDSMVGYRNARYERFGKVSARLDDIANYIPARITAVLIVVAGAMAGSREQGAGSREEGAGSKEQVGGGGKSGMHLLRRRGRLLRYLFSLLSLIVRQASRHPSPNAGYPIAAMGWTVCVRLGGPTRYGGVLKPKGWLGIGSRTVTVDDVRRALALQGCLDMLIVTILAIGAWW